MSNIHVRCKHSRALHVAQQNTTCSRKLQRTTDHYRPGEGGVPDAELPPHRGQADHPGPLDTGSPGGVPVLGRGGSHINTVHLYCTVYTNTVQCTLAEYWS